LSQTCLEAIYASWTHFFLQPAKDEFRPIAGELDGYFHRCAETAKGAQSPDPKEFFHFYRYGRCPDYCYKSTSAVFKCLADVAVEVLSDISNKIPDLAVYTRGLRDSRRLVLRISFSDATRNTRYFAAPHEDINFLTLLPRATGPGLEILAPNAEWVPVQANYQESIVLAGDMIEEASKGALHATRHSVRSSGNRRLSLSFFVNPDDHIVLSERWTAGTFLMHRLHEIGIKHQE